ncbi:AAA family ATPase [Pokkaliibacter sp. CJK22405]|uniref:AAA family ATPase n=1 Tax=Pokkaliibacter sp. CJK22405 TaxID=3384615 RepID=UPI003984A0C1
MKGVIFMGAQASGKSTFYLQQFYKTHIRINLDMLKTRHREALIFQACLNAKQPVVIDNTNPTREVRQKYLTGFQEHRFHVTGYFFESSLADCLRRNDQRQGKEKIPEVGVRSTYHKLEKPTLAEGFDELFSVKISDSGFVVSPFTL